MASILITGASSGIGAALARHYARPGTVLHLCGRNADRLAETAADCMDADDVRTIVLDVCDADAVRRWVEAADDAVPLDLVIANAGIAGGVDETSQRAIFDVNLTGVLNTVFPALDRMTPRRHGQIALISSIAGNRGFPSAPAYSASKAAVLAYAEGLRGAVQGTGIRVNAVCPGFVRSRITDQNDFPMPFFLEAHRAARIVADGLAKDRAKISFPWQMRALGWILRSLPSGMGTALLSRLPEKK